MQTLKTERLKLRPFQKDDFSDVHSYASTVENTLYMPWGPNTAEQTNAFIDFAIQKAAEIPCDNYQLAVERLDTGRVIGGCNLAIHEGMEGTAEIGWIVHRDYWRQGYGVELGSALLRFGFEHLRLHRIIARCDAENEGSYKLMERIGMRREGLLLEGRPPAKNSDRLYGDELIYAILRDEYETQKEIDYYNSLPCTFTGFVELPTLSDGEITLICHRQSPAIPEKKYVPAYDFLICRGSQVVGNIQLRIGYGGGQYDCNLYYGGQIGYTVNEQERGKGYAARACRLLLPVARAHDMHVLLITNAVTNSSSRRVCEKLGARLLRVARLPHWHDLYCEGQRFVNVFAWEGDCTAPE